MYRVDREDSKEDGVVLVKLRGRAQAETIVTLLNDRPGVAEGRPRASEGLAP